MRIGILALLIAVVSPAAAAPHKAGDLERDTGSVRAADGEIVPYEIGTLFVPENRNVPDSRLIGIGYARIRGTEAGREGPPTFHLAGGPGSSYLTVLTDKDDAAQRRLTDLLRYRSVGDVVLIDQRGFSTRGDVMNYAYPTTDQPLDRPPTLATERANEIALAKSVIAANPEKDLTGYTVLQCAEDVNDLRRALGYDKIDLVGQSFGSQWGFAVMKLHPEIVARALLSGVEPLDYAYDMPSHVFSALQRIAWDADHDAGLMPYLPKGGLMEAVRAVRERFARGPVEVAVKDRETGQVRTVSLGLADVQQGLLQPADAWPAFVLSLYHRHYEAWARDVIDQRKAGSEKDAAIGPLIDTSLGVTEAREHLLRTDPAGAFLGWWNFDNYIASAPYWPTRDVGDEFRTPVPNEIPVLFIHGDWDIFTPIENTLSMLPYFLRGRAILVHRAGHEARFSVMEKQPEIRDAVLSFLRSGETSLLPVTSEMPAPAFQRPSFAPPVRAAGRT